MGSKFKISGSQIKSSIPLELVKLVFLYNTIFCKIRSDRNMRPCRVAHMHTLSSFSHTSWGWLGNQNLAYLGLLLIVHGDECLHSQWQQQLLPPLLWPGEQVIPLLSNTDSHWFQLMCLLMINTVVNTYWQNYYRIFKYVNICSTDFKLEHIGMILFKCLDTWDNFYYIFSNFLLVLFL